MAAALNHGSMEKNPQKTAMVSPLSINIIGKK